ncbi:hypothetical protein M5585_07560 [Serratia ureilytica]
MAILEASGQTPAFNPRYADLFTRKPVEDGHVSFAYDSFKPHIEIPCR